MSDWKLTNHGHPEIEPAKTKRAIFIGRYQPYHQGHISLVRQKLDKGVPCLVMVRDIPPDTKNPFTTEQTIDMIRKYHASKGDDVEVMKIPDIESVNWGRGVGYEMNEFFPPENIGWISATKIRDSIKGGEDEWREMVDESIQEDVVKYLKDSNL
ncbi:MAG: adenylyltransferase/cytidyltransferase family protein [Candidatus Mycalebacterium zealandia]|nr:MAG: adenylyltransferase/cytidyltransferase family protein [Candidatus Mycalebacterium zealandia]